MRLVDGAAVPAFKASGDITSMSQADGYIEIPAQTDIVEAGRDRRREAVLMSHPVSPAPAPPFELPTQKGAPSLAEFLAKGPVLLAFHRGTW